MLKELLKDKNLSMYRLSQLTGIPYSTISDICSGQTDIVNCSAGTVYKIANVLSISMEELIESENKEYRSSFETFKSNVCHRVKTWEI